MKISAKVGISTRLYMKKFHKSQQDPNPSRQVNPGVEKVYLARRVDPGWLLRSCKYLLQVDRKRVDPLMRVEANPGSCKGDLRACLYGAPGWPALPRSHLHKKFHSITYNVLSCV